MVLISYCKIPKQVQIIIFFYAILYFMKTYFFMLHPNSIELTRYEVVSSPAHLCFVQYFYIL